MMANPIFILFIGIIVVVGGIIGFKLHPFLALLLAAIVVAILTPLASVEQFFLSKGMSAAEALQQSHKSIGERIGTEFGNTCAKIGILIAMAAIIGLDDSIVEKICAQAAQGEIVMPANYNAIGQIVISGALAAGSRPRRERYADDERGGQRLQARRAVHGAGSYGEIRSTFGPMC
jgi:hypothetical protein